jgi:hypothetical protein
MKRGLLITSALLSALAFSATGNASAAEGSTAGGGSIAADVAWQDVPDCGPATHEFGGAGGPSENPGTWVEGTILRQEGPILLANMAGGISLHLIRESCTDADTEAGTAYGDVDWLWGTGLPPGTPCETVDTCPSPSVDATNWEIRGELTGTYTRDGSQLRIDLQATLAFCPSNWLGYIPNCDGVAAEPPTPFVISGALVPYDILTNDTWGDTHELDGEFHLGVNA